MSKPQGQGSVWNVNSWHWETKNFTDIAKTLICSKIEALELKKDDLSIKVQSIASAKGDAQVNIRKGKQIICFEFEVEINWIAENSIDEVTGSLKISDINDSDLDFEISGINVNDKKEIATEAKSLIKKDLRKHLELLFKDIRDDLAKIESDPTKLEETKVEFFIRKLYNNKWRWLKKFEKKKEKKRKNYY